MVRDVFSSLYVQNFTNAYIVVQLNRYVLTVAKFLINLVLLFVVFGFLKNVHVLVYLVYDFNIK